MAGADVLIFVEDPGAANCVAHLPAALASLGFDARLMTSHCATEFMRQRGVPVESLGSEMSASTLLHSLQPRLVLVGTAENPATIGLDLIGEARRLHIETIGVVDAPGNGPYRFRGRSAEPLAHAPDRLIVFDDATKATFSALGFASQRIDICRHPQFEFVETARARLIAEGPDAVRRRVFPECADGRTIVIFGAEVSVGIQQEGYHRTTDYTLMGRGCHSDRTAIVLEEVLDALALCNPRPYVVLRLHPKNTSSDFEMFASEVDHVSAGTPAVDVIYAADIVIGMTSMLVFEAALLGKQTLSVVPRAIEASTLPGFHTGLVPWVCTRDELRARLKQMLNACSIAPHTQARTLTSAPNIVDVLARRLIKGPTPEPV